MYLHSALIGGAKGGFSIIIHTVKVFSYIINQFTLIDSMSPEIETFISFESRVPCPVSRVQTLRQYGVPAIFIFICSHLFR